MLVAVTGAAWLFVSSDMGRVLVAIRENEARCAYLGIPVSRIKILLMVATAGVAAVAGFGYAMFTDVVAPELTGFLLGTELLIWVALGGRGTLIGPVIGAILIDLTSSYLSGNLPFVWKLFVGIAFVAVIVVLPQGLMPLLTGAWRSLMPGAASARTAPALRVAAGAAPTRPAAEPLVVAALHRNFGSLQVLKGIDFTAHAGEILSLVGPNGAGKTTLIRCLADGLERSGGTVRVCGEDLGRRTARGVHRARHRPQVPGRECLRHAHRRRMSARRPRSGSSRRRCWRRAGMLGLPDAAVRIAAEHGARRGARRRSARPQPRPEAGLGAGDGAGPRAAAWCCSTSRRRG